MKQITSIQDISSDLTKALEKEGFKPEESLNGELKYSTFYKTNIHPFSVLKFNTIISGPTLSTSSSYKLILRIRDIIPNPKELLSNNHGSELRFFPSHEAIRELYDNLSYYIAGSPVPHTTRIKGIADEKAFSYNLTYNPNKVTKPQLVTAVKNVLGHIRETLFSNMTFAIKNPNKD